MGNGARSIPLVPLRWEIDIGYRASLLKVREEGDQKVGLGGLGWNWDGKRRRETVTNL